MSEAYWDRFETALGTLTVSVDGDGSVTKLVFGAADLPGRRSARRCREVREQLEEYLAGTRTQFDLKLKPRGTTFQKSVWKGLVDIPYGAVCGYGDLARNIGNPGAARAVGQANGANPIPIIIPCHRVIAADGSIGGFSSGLSIKRRLLAVEHIQVAA
jgi:methylated-DNA-[protein]-cysteine S-methyltransferase